jgi:hypothetical protein
MGDSRCLHVLVKKRGSDGVHFIRLNESGAKIMLQCCPACHTDMANGKRIQVKYQNRL